MYTLFSKNIVFPVEAEYSYFSVDFRLNALVNILLIDNNNNNNNCNFYSAFFMLNMIKCS